jgi:hypothetical protein
MRRVIDWCSLAARCTNDGPGFSRPSQDIISLLHASMEGALRQGDLPRLVELGLLHDYGTEACAYHHGIRAQLLYTQLKLEDDPSLPT